MLRVSAPQRLDQWIVAHGYAATREEAQAAIMAGDVTVDGVVADKPGRRMRPGARVAIRRPAHSYASRGGLKLAHALAAFGIDPRERTAVDLGASTGGFTDCLLQAGAARVYAVDVGRGQLAWRLRTDPRVVCLEGVNARHLTPAQVGGPCDLVTLDLAFISLRLVWKAIAALVRPGGDVIALIKPQFEAGRAHVGRGGVVRDPTVHEAVLRSALDTAAAAASSFPSAKFSTSRAGGSAIPAFPPRETWWPFWITPSAETTQVPLPSSTWREIRKFFQPGGRPSGASIGHSEAMKSGLQALESVMAAILPQAPYRRKSESLLASLGPYPFKTSPAMVACF